MRKEVVNSMKKKKTPMIDRLEKRFGKYAVSNLGKYIIMMYTIGTVITFLNAGFYNEWLALDFRMVLKDRCGD